MKARKENQRSIKMTAFSTFATALENKRREAGDGSKEKKYNRVFHLSYGARVAFYWPYIIFYLESISSKILA